MTEKHWPAVDKRTITVGDRVQLSGRFLRNTGQTSGGEGRKKWHVVACDCAQCKRGEWVAVDEPPAGLASGMYDDLPEAERPKHRHIAAGNLKIAGRPSGRDCG